MNTIKFDNADSLVEYCIKNNHLAGQVWVDHSPFGDGERTLVWFMIEDSKRIHTFAQGQHSIGNIHYTYSTFWHKKYKGSYELVLPFTQHTKPEVYEVGDWVEVLPNVKQVYDSYGNGWSEQETIFKITQVIDYYHGISYRLNCDGDFNVLPHYCVKKVETPKKTKISKKEIAKKFGVDVANIEITE